MNRILTSIGPRLHLWAFDPWFILNFLHYLHLFLPCSCCILTVSIPAPLQQTCFCPVSCSFDPLLLLQCFLINKWVIFHKFAIYLNKSVSESIWIFLVSCNWYWIDEFKVLLISFLECLIALCFFLLIQNAILVFVKLIGDEKLWVTTLIITLYMEWNVGKEIFFPLCM